MTTATVADARQQLRDMQELGVRWLLARIGDDGKPAHSDEHHGYYRFPWTLAYVGEREASAAVLSWIETNALTESGDLREGVPRAAWVHGAATYPLTIIAQGAWLNERYDTALAVMDTLRRSFQDPGSGGALWERPEVRVSGVQMSFTTAQLGLTSLATGRQDMADAVFRWYQNLLAAQPALPHKLFPVWGPDGLLTVFPESLRFNALVDFGQPMQAFHNPGIAAAFLSRYALVNPDSAAAAMASDLLALNAGGTAEQFDHRQSTSICKFGWGSAMLNDVSPREDLVRNIVRMTRWFFDSQLPDGSWTYRTPSRPEPSAAHVMEKTVEHLLWIAMMASSLARNEVTAL